MKTAIPFAIAMSLFAGCAVDDNAETAESDLQVTTDDQALAAPSDLDAPRPGTPVADDEFLGCNSRDVPLIELRWHQTGGAPATRYDVDIQRGTGTWQPLYDGNLLSILYSGGDGRLDHARVRACNAAGCSAFFSFGFRHDCDRPPQ